ncbi:hypothetical protein RRG08_060167 [Elysia crispata]|uniref:Uncharacterized protein n=1 Tax=Elysia crispata TaxID=231223 RepID=A0AAE0ZZC0_9GAST|nr:hypothetical protein RRG08_060167 [Elysia crispata]
MIKKPQTCNHLLGLALTFFAPFSTYLIFSSIRSAKFPEDLLRASPISASQCCTASHVLMTQVAAAPAQASYFSRPRTRGVDQVDTQHAAVTLSLIFIFGSDGDQVHPAILRSYSLVFTLMICVALCLCEQSTRFLG